MTQARRGGATSTPPRRLTFLIALLAVLFAGAAAQATSKPTLDVVFAPDGSVTVSLPDGTPVGTTNGAPTVIPAGYYTVALSGPEGCSETLYIEFHGPGVNIYGGLSNGEVANATYNAYFAPNSAYTWRNDQFPNVVYTFTTSGTIAGTPPVPTVTTTKPGSGGPVLVGSSQDVLGSKTTSTPFRGTLAGTVAATGRLTLQLHGQTVSRLLFGIYTLTVSDRSPKNGFVLQQSGQPPIPVTSARFRGKRTVRIDLAAGTWLLSSSLTSKTTTFSVVR